MSLTKGSVKKLMPSIERTAVAVPICVMLMVLLKVEGGMMAHFGLIICLGERLCDDGMCSCFGP